MRDRFFNPYQQSKLPKEFINPPLVKSLKPLDLIWGPFLGLLINTNHDNCNRIAEWKQNSSEVVIYLQKIDSQTECLIQWWTHREHLFLVTRPPSCEDGVLVLHNVEESLELWLRPIGEWEQQLHEHVRSLYR